MLLHTAVVPVVFQKLIRGGAYSVSQVPRNKTNEKDKFLKFTFGIGLHIFWRFADRAAQYIYLSI